MRRQWPQIFTLHLGVRVKLEGVYLLFWEYVDFGVDHGHCLGILILTSTSVTLSRCGSGANGDGVGESGGHMWVSRWVGGAALLLPP